MTALKCTSGEAAPLEFIHEAFLMLNNKVVGSIYKCTQGHYFSMYVSDCSFPQWQRVPHFLNSNNIAFSHGHIKPLKVVWSQS